MRKYVILVLLLFIAQVFFGIIPKALSDELGLSADQKKKIEDVMISYSVKFEDFMTQLKIKQLELKQLLLADEPNKANIKDKLKDISTIEVEMRYLKFEQDQEILKQLNDDQKKKYKFIRINRLNMMKMHENMMKMNGMKKDNDKNWMNNNKKQIPGCHKPESEFLNFEDEVCAPPML